MANYCTHHRLPARWCELGPNTVNHESNTSFENTYREKAMLKKLRTSCDLKVPITRLVGRRVRMMALTSGSLIAFAAVSAAHAQVNKSPYPTKAPTSQYLMASQTDEIAQARSAAPASISNDADVLILDSHGYET